MGYHQQPDLLFAALAGQLKVPLLQIARLSDGHQSAQLAEINLISSQSLHLVDAYLHANEQTELPFEPLNTSAVLYDVATSLNPLARAVNYDITVDLQGSTQPIMAHHDTLKTMLVLLGSSIIEAGSEEPAARKLVLGTHRSANGVVVGVFSPQTDISQRVLHLTRQLHGRANQAVPVLGAAGGAGLAIADSLSERLSAPLRAYRHRRLVGIGSLLAPSQQLSLVM